MPTLLEKRPRDEDVEGGHGKLEGLDHQSPKRRRILPIRTPQKRAHHPLPNSLCSNPLLITPADSSSSSSSSSSPSMSPSCTDTLEDDDDDGNDDIIINATTSEDFDMIDSQPASSPLPWFSPSPTTPNTNNPATNTRIPTPIHPYFSRADINMSDLSPIGNANPAPTSWHDPGLLTSYTESWNPAPPRARRLPSPISEGADDDDLKSPATSLANGLLKGLGVSDMEVEDGEVASTVTQEPGTATARSDKASVESSREGEGKGKMVFSMGFRADCEKCRMRVPGHYSHVFRV